MPPLTRLRKLELTTLLVQRGLIAGVEALEDEDARGATALWTACNLGHEEDALDLIEAGADVNAACTAGGSVERWNALYRACEGGHAATVS